MENKKNKSKGIWIPEVIKTDEKLDWTNKALLAEIYSLCELPDGCIASDNHFGKILGIKRPSVNKRVNKLEDLGYITSKNHYKGKLCVGRTITKGGFLKKHTLVPEVENGSSYDSQEVVLGVEDISSFGNTINTLTNSNLIIQKTIQNTGETLNLGISMNQFLNSRYSELVDEIVEKSSLGEDIFYYTDATNLSMFRDVVDEKEYNLVYPILVKIIDINKKLFGN